MSRSINKLTLLGNVGADPEVRDTRNGSKLARISLATTRYNPEGEDWTDWHEVSAFGKLAELVGQYVRKGDRLFIEARVSYSRSENGDGTSRKWTNLIAEDLIFLGSEGRRSA